MSLYRYAIVPLWFGSSITSICIMMSPKSAAHEEQVGVTLLAAGICSLN
jgi:hypothetical protein